MKNLLIYVFALTIYGCQNPEVVTSEKENSTKTEETHTHTEEGLKLNNQEHWKVVPDMMNYITYMKEDVENFEGKSLEDYQELSTDLLINIDLLTANCTMKGEAHDQLHLWLVPFIGLVDNFATAETVENAHQYYKELQNYFVEFDRFFK